MISEKEVKDLLHSCGYLANDAIATTVFLALEMEKPILIEGPPGVGKTDLAKALAASLDLSLVRLQCYDGIDEGKALYDWEYGKQLLYTQLLRRQFEALLSDSADLGDAVLRLAAEEDLFFSGKFLVQRPILRSFLSQERSVLLIDEIDRSDDGFEALLLECLSEFQVSIPEMGVIEAHRKPLTILTSNGSRMISDALRRRCLFLHIGYPEPEREVEIVRLKVPDLCQDLVRQMVEFLRKARFLDLRKTPGLSQTLEWAQILAVLQVKELNWSVVASTAGSIFKHESDLQRVTDLAYEVLG